MSLSPSVSDKNAIHHDVPYSRPSTPSASQYRIGFVGLGAMGYPMARALSQHHLAHPLLVYNRTRSKAEALAHEVGPSIRISHSLAELVRNSDVIFTNLGSDEATRAVYEEFSIAIKDSNHQTPKIFAETSTIFPTVASELDALISKIPHTHFISCPIFGPPTAAVKSHLILVMSGDYRSKKVVAHLAVPAMARKVIDLGGNIEKAATFKLLGNSMILGCIELLGEAMTLADKSGCGADKLYDFVKEFLPAVPFLTYGPKMLKDEFDGSKGFIMEGGMKDASHIRRLSAMHDSPMPVVDIAYQHMLTARAIHAKQIASGTAKNEILDWSALVAGSRVSAGLPGLDSSQVPSKVVRED